MKALGADKVIDYTKDNFNKNNEIYDVIFDTVGKSSFSDCMESLQREGFYLQALAVPAMSLRMHWASIKSKKTFIGGTAVPKAENLKFLKELVETGKYKASN